MYNPIFNNEKLKKSRKKRKLSIKEVAEKIDVPVTTLQKYESGSIKKIPLDKLKKYVIYMKLIIICILGGQDLILCLK